MVRVRVEVRSITEWKVVKTLVRVRSTTYYVFEKEGLTLIKERV